MLTEQDTIIKLFIIDRSRVANVKQFVITVITMSALDVPFIVKML